MKEKKTSKNRRVKPIKRTPTQFTVDLDIKGIILFIGLGLLTALVIFYLGMIFGKASRNPNAHVTSSKGQSELKTVTEEEISTKDLEVFDIRSDGEKVKNLQSDTKSALIEADRIISESKNQLTTQKTEEPALTKTKSQEAADPVAEVAPKKQWPEQQATSKSQQESYTVQVFATKDKDKADRIVRLLRQKEFDAYLAEATIENQKIYRVRVGRKSKAEIAQLNEKLKSVIGGMGMKSRIIQIN
ncbi:SPOR domain-containing protein [bacterium]|nr:SPOR domain-containing protein [bacterium]